MTPRDPLGPDHDKCSMCGAYIPDPVVLTRVECNGSFRLMSRSRGDLWEPSGLQVLFCGERCCKDYADECEADLVAGKVAEALS